jgi:hypothetical protein
MTNTTKLDVLERKNQKLTLLVIGGGMMGCDSRNLIVTKGRLATSHGWVLCCSKPRARKVSNLERPLQSGAILLRGHLTKEDLPVFEGDVRYYSAGGFSSFSMVLDGRGGRFVDAAGDGGATLLTNLKQHLLLHTLRPTHDLTLFAKKADSSGEGEVLDSQFQHALIAALGEPVEMPDAAPIPTPRVSLFTDAMKEQLKAACDNEEAKPLFRLFMPGSAHTWLVCSMEDDGDTLWVVADLGFGCVEYGTQSLEELETARSKTFKYPVERDLHWSGTDKSMSEILRMESIQTGV